MHAGADSTGSTTGRSPLIDTRTCFPTFSQPHPASTMNRAALRSMSKVPSSSLVPSDCIGVRVLYFFHGQHCPSPRLGSPDSVVRETLPSPHRNFPLAKGFGQVVRGDWQYQAGEERKVALPTYFCRKRWSMIQAEAWSEPGKEGRETSVDH